MIQLFLLPFNLIHVHIVWSCYTLELLYLILWTLNEHHFMFLLRILLLILLSLLIVKNCGIVISGRHFLIGFVFLL